MIREEYLAKLRENLKGLPEQDIQESLDYYKEMLADRMEEGLTEEAAVEALPDPADAAREILLDKPLPQVIRARGKGREKRKIPVWAIVLLIIGSVVWLPLLAAAGAVILAVYVSIWAVIISVYAVDAALAGMAIAGVIYAIHFVIHGGMAQVLFYIGVALMALGGAVLLFFGAGWITKQLLRLSAAFGRWVKSLFVGRKPTNKKSIVN